MKKLLLKDAVIRNPVPLMVSCLIVLVAILTSDFHCYFRQITNNISLNIILEDKYLGVHFQILKIDKIAASQICRGYVDKEEMNE